MHGGVGEDRQVIAEQQHVFSLMALIERKYRRQMKQQLKMVQASPREHEVLVLIGEGRAQSPSALARASGVSRQLMHRVLNRLESDKLIQRWTMGSDADTKVGLTRQGELLLEETEQFVRSFRSSVLSRFGVQHHMALRALLVSLDEVLETARRRPDFIDE